MIRRLHRSALLRTILTSVFVLFMLAAAHLFMVVINAAERTYEYPDPAMGQSARLFSDRPMTEEIEAALATAKTVEDQAVLEDALQRAEAGETIALRTLPVTQFLWLTALGLCVAGFVPHLDDLSHQE